MCDKAFNITKNPKYDGCQRDLASMVYKFFDKKPASLARSKTLAARDKSASGSGIKNENISNKELAEELHKPLIRKFNKRKVQLFFKDNIWGADLTDMQLIRKFNKGIRFLLCVLLVYYVFYYYHIFGKYAWAILMKDKRDIRITNAFQKFLKQSQSKQNMGR